jgi:gluconate kinase
MMMLCVHEKLTSQYQQPTKFIKALFLICTRALTMILSKFVTSCLLALQGGETVYNKDFPTVVVFGRPGAGKSSVANAAIDKLMTSADASKLECLGLDLDICVPQWMRDNFSKGVYPTLEQRQEFALGACDYVDEQIQQGNQKEDDLKKLAAVVSFSFVNTDLRDAFRSRFPHAKWVLVDTTDEEATNRVNMREGHFYKSITPGVAATIAELEENEGKDIDKSEWEFAPVTFEHVILEGSASIDVNAEKVLMVLLKTAGLDKVP